MKPPSSPSPNQAPAFAAVLDDSHPHPDERRAHWEKVFGEKDEAEVSWFQTRPAMSLDFIRRTGANPSAKIVDVGGGASRLVDELIDAGYADIVVVDIAAAALAKARARLAERTGRVQWVVSDIAQWQPEAAFDVWHDRAVFHFMVQPEDRDAYLTTMRRALKRGGHAIIATFGSNGPERCSGLVVQRYEPETLEAVLGPDFRRIESMHEEHVTPAGKVQAFQFSLFERVQ
ncbi:hypothetical protein AKJ09_11126 [Labilithrix luteola]|uniref:Methyltransferase domain-containing protein n=1 Tax=Labilithrix luteola TaxID=1391654 RepID=A0A0K1QFG4_9BACT|nr:class I SAM-dependent methyltransferase [Labilithrix luteola]AKV04463.1 hypothetical protein AKJ09_11126 [Labilithrix luteola]